MLGAPTIVKSDPAVVRVLVAERTFPSGHCSPILAQEADDELLYVLEGEITIVDHGRESQVGRGDCVALPRGHARAYRNDGAAAAKGLIISQPGIQAAELFRNLDRASRAARSAGRPLSDHEVDQITGQYGVQIHRQ